MTLKTILELLRSGEPDFGQLQSLVVFPRGNARAIWQHRTMCWDSLDELSAWGEAVIEARKPKHKE